MSETVILLLIISTALSAYARGRREGTWSWPLFIITLLWLWALGGVVAAGGVWFGRLMGPEHALLATVMIVGLIVAGVVISSRWVCSKTAHHKK
jgi:hypothetical protein